MGETKDLVIACPDCGTRYKTKTDAIGPDGRTVRCARCKETWFVPSPELSASAPTADELALSDLRADPIAAPVPVGAATPIKPIDTTPDPDLGRRPSADVLLRDRTDATKLAKRRRTIRLIWLVTAMIALAAILAAFLNRQAIVNRIPQAATLYQGLGINVYAGGLQLAPPIAEQVMRDGEAVLLVRSELRNLTGDALAAPLVELTLRDADGAELAQWFVEPDEDRVAARERVEIETEYAAPPEGVADVGYRLVDRNGGQA